MRTEIRTPNKENILKWVEALESGKFEQGTGTLAFKPRDERNWFARVFLRKGAPKAKFCCLGVACETAIRNGVKLSVRNTGTALGYRIYDEDHSMLPQSVARWLGLYTNPDITDYVTATRANDDYNWNFAKIAEKLRYRYLTNDEPKRNDTPHSDEPKKTYNEIDRDDDIMALHEQLVEDAQVDAEESASLLDDDKVLETWIESADEEPKNNKSNN